jgi:Tfp pilus assembly protein PilF
MPSPSRAAGAPHSTPVSAGPRIGGRYEVLRDLGKGAFGEVTLCHDHQERRLVALKTFQSQHLSDRHSRELFLREGGIWMTLGAHPNIVQAYEINAFEHGLRVYIALEPVQPPEGRTGPSLDRWIADGRLPLDLALGLGLDIARGMRHATERFPGLVHRDLKLQNILVGRDGRARVSDFGLAAALYDAQKTHGWAAEEPGMVAGTLLYMAPEQFAGDALDQRADIFAFGCILYELLLSQAPLYHQFQLGEDHVRHLVSQGRLRAIPAGLPGPLSELLSACLAPRRQGRPASWQTLEHDIEVLYRRLTGREPHRPSAPPAATAPARMTEALLALARGYYDIGKLTQAIQMAEEALASARTSRQSRGEIEAVELAAKIAAAQGDFERAWTLFNQGFTLARTQAQPDLQKIIANGVGLMLLDRSNLDAAQSWLEEALRLSRHIVGSQDQAAIMSNLALIAHRQGDSAQALNRFAELLKAALAQEHHHHILIALMNIAYVLNELGDQPAAIPLFLRSCELAQSIGRFDREVEIAGNLAYAYYLASDYVTAVEAFHEHLTLARELGDREEIQRACQGLALSLIESEEPERALAMVQEVIQYARAVADWSGQATGHSLLAQAHQKLRETDEAARNFTIAAQLYGKAGSVHEQEQAEEQAASIRREREESHAERAHALQKATATEQYLEIAGDQVDQEKRATLLMLCGGLYLEAQHYQRAQRCLERALSLARRGGLHQAVFECLDLLMAASGGLTAWDAMRRYGEELLALALNTYPKDECLPLYEKLHVVYTKLGHRDSALRVLHEALCVAYDHNRMEPYLRLMCALARLRLDRREPGPGLEAAQLAMQISQHIGVSGELAALYLHCARTLSAADRRADAAAYAEVAEELYQELGRPEAAAVATRLAIALRFPLPALDAIEG